MNYTIEMFDSLGGDHIYTPELIYELLMEDPQELKHGETFTGRPGTSLRISKDHVVKIRMEIKTSLDKAREWVQRACDKEKHCKAHHPHKTWFIFYNPESSSPLIGNICPQLTPLHKLFDDNSVALSDRLLLMKSLFILYFRVMREEEMRLDDGLSNYGVDENNNLYYLDDDIYLPDSFNIFSHMLGVYIRRYEWLDEEICSVVGEILVKVIEEGEDSEEIRHTIVRFLKDLFMPPGRAQDALNKLKETIRPEFKLVSRRKKAKESDEEEKHDGRYLAILADVHANLPALEAVLSYLSEHKIHDGIVLGDTVGYGPYPSQCIERLAGTGLTVLKGNHDHAVVVGNRKKGFSRMGAWVIEWTIDLLGESDKAWLGSLPEAVEGDGWLAVHGAPVDSTFFNGYVYEMTYKKNLDNLQQRNIPLCFHGHTHVMGMYGRKKGKPDGFLLEDEVNLNNFDFSLVCPGSVGQARNGNPQAQFGIYDREEQRMNFIGLDYEIEKTISEMKALGFPDTLGERLLLGR